MKNLKCYCNDDIICPLKLNKNQLTIKDDDRHCSTNTVCLTKRLRRLNGTTWLKYFCDQSSSESIRGKVIEYRDCKINSTNKHDKQQAEKSSEYCCDSHDYCNKYLNPINSVRDIEEFTLLTSNDININTNNNNNNQLNNGLTLFTTINLVLLSSLLVFLILTIILILLYFIKNNKIIIKSKLNLNNNNSKKLISNLSSSISTATSNSTTATSLNSKENSYNSSSLYPNNNNNNNNNKYLTKYNNKQNSTNIEENNELLKSLLINKLNNNNYDQDYNESRSGQITTSTTNSNSLGNSSSSSSEVIISSIDENQSIPTTTTTNQSNSDCNYDWSGSGSGAGVPQLLQRTIARQIKLIYPCIGKGRFGEVYKGMWRDEYVAVKTFNSADEKSWQNECNIYNTNGFRHENILGFIASDNIDRGTYTELWIITEFHSNGSLFDYLNQNTLTIYECLKMAISIVNGLDHLHTPIESCTGKPALAHCDLKSKNILVKSDLTCCIGDLGLALCGDKNGNIQHHYQQQQYYSNSNNDDIITIRTGTKRYMAPEILNKTINIKSLYQFQNAEMYSLALIFWELLTRTKFELLNKIYIYEYKLPYYQYLPMDPNDLQMKQIVCEQKLRPEINYLWKQINIMNELTQLTEELWVENSNGRLNALRLKKSLNSIMRKYCLLKK
jgi:TGF-beta receptor type-1